MIYILLVSTGVACSICLQVNGQCATSRCKGFPEEIEETLVTASVMQSVGKQRNVQCSTPFREEEKACPSGFDFLPEAGGCFKVIFQKHIWSEADKVCRGVMSGVHLAAITSAAKQKAIENYLNGEFNKSESSVCVLAPPWSHYGKSVWIGGRKINTASFDITFVWKTLDSIDIPFNYTNWDSNEPTRLANEYCVHMTKGYDYKWNDCGCDLPSCPFCELYIKPRI